MGEDAYGGDDGRVVMARRVAEPVDRHVEALLQRAPRGRDLVAQCFGVERDEVRVVEALRVELPAGSDQFPYLPLQQAALRRR